jgi:hypothetical protein
MAEAAAVVQEWNWSKWPRQMAKRRRAKRRRA